MMDFLSINSILKIVSVLFCCLPSCADAFAKSLTIKYTNTPKNNDLLTSVGRISTSSLSSATSSVSNASKKLVKDKQASEDDQKRAEADIQKVTDRHVASIDQLVHAKEQDIMAV